jgi:hypothetical protein
MELRAQDNRWPRPPGKKRSPARRRSGSTNVALYDVDPAGVERKGIAGFTPKAGSVLVEPRPV